MQKIILCALILVLVACSAPAPVIPTVPSTSIPTSIPTLTETATPIPTETPTPEAVAITMAEWIAMTPEERTAAVPALTESGANNPTFLGDNPAAFYFNADGILAEGVNGLTGEGMDQQQVFKELLDMNGITQENAFEDTRAFLKIDYQLGTFLGIPISRENAGFQMRLVILDGKTYYLEGKDYVTRDVSDGSVRKIFVVKGVADANKQFLKRDVYVEYETQFGVAMEVGFTQKITNPGMLKRPVAIPYLSAGYLGVPFERMWDGEPYPEGYKWPEDLSVFIGTMRPNDGEW